MPVEPTRFGKYLLYERIAVGGMAEVFRAAQAGVNDLQLAVKRIHPHHLENEDFVSMLIDEAKISSQLTHPNIVHVVDLGRVDKHYFIAMEFISGRDLRRVMERLVESNRTFPIPEAVAIIAKVCRGLDYAHQREDVRGRKLEIIHRDISPQNIIVSFEGEVKVIDFGIAKAAGRLMETQVGILKGKYAYMSPEQAAGGPLDHRTDIFSTGIMLYECLVGRHPFRAAHDLETLRNIKNGTMVMPREANPKIPPSVEAVVLQALAGRKEDRYFTAGAMAADLEAALEDLRPGYTDANLAEFVQGLFADEISGGPVRERPAPQQQTGPSNRAVRLGGGGTSSAPSRTSTASMSGSASLGGGGTATEEGSLGSAATRPALDPNGSVSRTASLVGPSVAPPVPRRPSTTGVRQTGTSQAVQRPSPSRVVSSSPPPGGGAADPLRSFVDRALTGQLTQADSVAVIAISLVVFLLALILLVWQPGAGPKHPPIAPRPGTTTAPGGATGGLAELTVDSNPRDAEVTVTGQLRGRTPLRVPGLPAGVPVDVGVSKAGYETKHQTGTPGRDPVFVSLRSVPTGKVDITSDPGNAEVRVGDSDAIVGRTPIVLDLPEGSTLIRVRDPASGAEGSQTVRITAGTPMMPINFSLR